MLFKMLQEKNYLKWTKKNNYYKYTLIIIQTIAQDLIFHYLLKNSL